MANVLVQQSTMAAIASAIRDKANTSETFKPSQMATAIADISTGINPDRLEMISIDTSLNNLAYYFYRGAAVVYNGEIYIMGSNYSSSYYKSFSKWNGSSWTSLTNIPYNFQDGCAVVYNGEIHILGCSNSAYYTNHYKWNGSSWVNASTIPYGFSCGSAIVYNDEIHILGGEIGDSNKKHYKWDGTSWTSVSTLPYVFNNSSALILDNEIHIVGGAGNTKGHYKWDGTSWTSVSTLPYDFCYSKAVVYNNEIHLLGSAISGNYTKHYKWDGTSWASVSILPYDFKYGCAVVNNDKIYLLGSDVSNMERKFYSLTLCYKLLPVIHLTLTSEPGATITYSANGKSKSFTYTEEKTVELDSLGTYTVTASLNGQESTKTVNVTERKDYSVDLPALSLTIISEAGNTITWSDGINTGEFVSTGSDVIKSFVLGIWQIDAVNDDGEEKSKTINIGSYGEYSVKVNIILPTVVPFATATDEEIVNIVDAYYDDDLSIDDIKAVWSVGDTRSIDLAAMGESGIANANSMSETHTAQTVEMVIIDFEHDDLTTSINGHSKALLTLNQKDCMKLESNPNYMYENVARDMGLGSMINYTGSHTYVGGWASCARRNWCNYAYKNAIPSTLKNAIKNVKKLTSAGNQSSTIDTTNDYVFLLSEIEIFGIVKYSFAGEGSQYNYFSINNNNKIKNPKFMSGSKGGIWYQRSPYSTDSYTVCVVSENGIANDNSPGNTFGLAPAFCL